MQFPDTTLGGTASLTGLGNSVNILPGSSLNSSTGQMSGNLAGFSTRVTNRMNVLG